MCNLCAYDTAQASDVMQRFNKVSLSIGCSARQSSSLTQQHFRLAQSIDYTNLSTWLQGEMRSNHAGETGAVWIYKGAQAAMKLRSSPPRMHAFASEHLETERQHLALFDEMLPASALSRALPLWRLSGFMLGFLPALLHPRAFFCTIEAVERFVEEHYMCQINPLENSGQHHELVQLLRICCEEEVNHADEAASLWRGGQGPQARMHPALAATAQAWSSVVASGSKAAVWLAKRV